MLYLIGLGLNEKGISIEGVEVVRKCKKIYLEGYTIDFPYKTDRLDNILKKKIIKLGRGEVESDNLVKEAKKEDVALLVYGSPLFATTHMTLLLDCKKAKVKTKVIYSASVFDAIAETGLQLYKFGKISSMPKWQKSFEPDSFLEFTEENRKDRAHSLILVDIDLDFLSALEELEISCKRRGFDIENIVVCSRLGTERSNIIYGSIDRLKKAKGIKAPYCFIIPGEMHFMEKESLERFLI